MFSQPLPLLHCEFHPLPIVIACCVLVGELNSERLIGSGFSISDMSLKFDSIHTSIGCCINI